MFKFLRKVSFHPYLSAAIEILAGIIFVFSSFTLFINWWAVLVWMVLRSLWFAMMVAITYYPADINIKKINHFLALLLFNVGTLCLLLFTEWTPMKIVTIVLMIACPAISFYLVPPQKNILSFLGKPQRRFLLLLCAIGLFGIWTGESAIVLFNVFAFLNIQTVLIIFTSLLGGGVSFWLWYWYGAKMGKELLAWSGVATLIIFELSWAIFTTPVGHFVYGLSITWIWYNILLIVRFYLSIEDVKWKKQVPFLIGNMIIFLIFMVFLVKWR